MGAKGGDMSALWCQFKLMVARRQVKLTENGSTIQISDQVVNGRHQMLLTLDRLVCLTHVDADSNFTRGLGDNYNGDYPRGQARNFLDNI